MGEYILDIQISSNDPFEIDPENNFTSHSFYVFDKIEHEYSVTVQNKNILEIENSGEGYEFPWLESYVIIENNKLQSWDFVTIVPELQDNWSFEADNFLHLSQETTTLVKIKPPINTETGDYRINLNIIDRNGFEAGEGTLTVNVPQYYGVGIRAELNSNEIDIIIKNNGNGKDNFKLEKALENGLELFLSETYFELSAFEEVKIKAIGIQTNETKDYQATFIVKSIGNQNITAEVNLDIKGAATPGNRDWNITLIFASFGILGISYLIYQRRIE